MKDKSFFGVEHYYLLSTIIHPIWYRYIHHVFIGSKEDALFCTSVIVYYYLKPTSFSPEIRSTNNGENVGNGPALHFFIFVLFRHELYPVICVLLGIEYVWDGMPVWEYRQVSGTSDSYVILYNTRWALMGLPTEFYTVHTIYSETCL